MQTLFIGGPWDGRLIAYKLEGQTLTVHEREFSFFSYNTAPDLRVPYRTVEYVKLDMFGYQFMVEKVAYERGRLRDNNTYKVVLDLLMQGYRRPGTISGENI